MAVDFMPCDPEAVTEEQTELDFKSSFDPTSPREWCELIKDFVAIANSGGGTILFGVNDDGSPSGADVAAVLAVDPAAVTDKVHSYTEQQFAGFAIRDGTRQGQRIAVLHIAGARFPMVFTRPGQYNVEGKTRSAFPQGTVYFRHGAKSEAGSTEDLRLSLERELERVKDFWLTNIAKVVEAPAGSHIQILPPEVQISATDDARKVRLSTEEGAQVFKVVQPDDLYPYRQKELLARLAGEIGCRFTGHDLRIIRRLHNIDDNPNYSGKSRWGTRQYSEEFAAWLVEQCKADLAFMDVQREIFKNLER